MVRKEKTILGSVYERFAQEAPVAVMVRETIEWCLSPEQIDRLFEKSAQEQYQHQLFFSAIFKILSEVVCNVHRSVHAAYQARRSRMEASVVALYSKLKGTEAEVLSSLVRHTGQKFGPIVEQTGGALAPLLPGRRVRIVDGSCVEASQRRLKVLRGFQDRPLPGKALVVLDPAQMLIVDMLPCEDGYAQERALLPALRPLMQAGDLWIGDRNLCTLNWVQELDEAQAAFVVRQHGNFPVQPLEEFHPVGRNGSGQVSEQKVQVQLPNGALRQWRRIRVDLDTPTREGERQVLVLTNLSAQEADALKVAELYLERWTIERVFQEIETSLQSEINTLAYPKAALFGLCVGLVAYNTLSVVKAAMRAAHGPQKVEQEVSGYYLAEELESTGRGLEIAIPQKSWEEIRQWSSRQLARELVRLAQGMELCRYQKHPRGPKKPQPPRHRLGRGVWSHVSTARLLQAQKGKVTLSP